MKFRFKTDVVAISEVSGILTFVVMISIENDASDSTKFQITLNHMTSEIVVLFGV